MTSSPTHRHAGAGLLRGIAKKCPQCGEGHLFCGYLKVCPTCEACGHDTGSYRADDGPAYFTMLIVGHIVVVPLLLFSFVWKAPIAVVLVACLSLLSVVTLALLPIVKGGFIGVQWALKGGSGD
jgi:uncharacterized protein (DUF983 family)